MVSTHSQQIASQAPAFIEQVRDESKIFHQIILEMGNSIVGNESILQALVIAVLCDGHILLEGVPGVAKTTMIKVFATILGLDCKRIQFTPDLLPSDLIGTMIYNQKTGEFETRRGPIFASIVLADEINRAPAKVQSALLEAMQERQVTIGNTTFKLEEPFFVLATQNPLEQEGTYALPEAQVDRFFMKLLVDYPTLMQERHILQGLNHDGQLLRQLVDRGRIIEAQSIVRHIYVDERIVEYILQIIFALRHPSLAYNRGSLADYITCGPSPRASIALYRAAQAHAFLKGRHFVMPDDIKAGAHGVLRHRIIRSYRAEADKVTADALINEVLSRVKAP